jgi:hypothetical protein
LTILKVGNPPIFPSVAIIPQLVEFGPLILIRRVISMFGILRTGVNVMNNIYCDFSNIRRKKIGVFLKNCAVFQNSNNLSKKPPIFAKLFGENIF